LNGLMIASTFFMPDPPCRSKHFRQSLRRLCYNPAPAGV